MPAYRARFFPLAAAALLHTGGASGEELRLDPARTSIVFFVDGVGWPRTRGEFKVFDGRVSVDFERPAASSVTFRVTAKSLDVGSPAFSDYVRSDAFLDAARFPEIVFSSTSVEKRDERHARVLGALTMRGQTRPMAIDVEVNRGPGGRGRTGFRATGVIHRLEFGMNAGFPVISNDISLIVSTEAAPP